VDESSALPPTDKDDNDDNDFGDFGSAEEGTATATPTIANDSEQTKPVGHSETNGVDGGDFSDFGGCGSIRLKSGGRTHQH
jgi:hypothetical protein